MGIKDKLARMDEFERRQINWAQRHPKLALGIVVLLILGSLVGLYKCAKAADVQVSWTPPVQNTDNSP